MNGYETLMNRFKTWGLEREVDTVELGLSFARTVRAITGQGSGPLELLGFSSGATTAYVVANQETQNPP